MPIAKFQLPDGRVARFEVPDGTTPEQAERLMSQYFAAPQQEAPPAKTPGVVESGIAGLKKLLSSQRTALESPFGAEEAAQRGLARSRELEAKTPSQLSLEAVKKKYAEEGMLPAAGEVLRQAPHFIAEQAPQLGEMIAGGRVGALAGSPFGPVGSFIGGTAGAVAPLFTQAYGTGAERRAAEGLEQDPTKTAVSAAGQAGVEYVATLLPFGKQLLGRMLGIGEKEAAAAMVNPAARAMAEESLKKTLAKGAAVGTVAEIPAEVTQQMLERWQANLPLLSDDALKEYQEAAYGAALFGTPLGGVGRVAQRGEARRQVAAADAAEAAERARVEQEKEAAEKAKPEYILGVGQRFEALKEQERALLETRGKKLPKDATDEQRALFEDQTNQLRDLRAQLKELAPEYNAVKGKLAALREEQRIAGLTPQEYFDELHGYKKAEEKAPAATVAEDPMKAWLDQQVAEVPARPASQLQKEFDEALGGLRHFDMLTPADAADVLSRDPVLMQKVYTGELTVPEFNAKQNRELLDYLKLQVKDLASAMAKGRTETAATREKVQSETEALQRIAEKPLPGTEAATQIGLQRELEGYAGQMQPGVSAEPGLQKQNYIANAKPHSEAAEEALLSITEAKQDIEQRETLDSPSEAKRKFAASTTETLRNRIEAEKQRYADAVFNEVANLRQAENQQALTRDAIKLATAQIRSAIDAFATGQASEAALRRQLDVTRARLLTYRPALQKQGLPTEGPLTAQSSYREAQRVAEERGDTAETLEGQLRRKRDYVGGLLDRVLPMGATVTMTREAREALTDVQDAIENGTATNDMLDRAGDIADRAMRGQSVKGDVAGLRDAIRSMQQAQAPGIEGGQQSLFGTEDLGVVRATAANFRRFLGSKQVAELRALLPKVEAVVQREVKKQERPGTDAEFYRKRIDTLEKQISDAKEMLEDLGGASWQDIMETRAVLPAEIQDARRRLYALMQEQNALEMEEAEARKQKPSGTRAPYAAAQAQAKTAKLKDQIRNKEVNILLSLRNLTAQIKQQRKAAIYDPIIAEFEKRAAAYEAQLAKLEESMPESGAMSPELDDLYNEAADLKSQIATVRAEIAKVQARAEESDGNEALLAAADARIVAQKEKLAELQKKLDNVDLVGEDRRKVQAEANKLRQETAVAEGKLREAKELQAKQAEERKRRIAAGEGMLKLKREVVPVEYTTRSGKKIIAKEKGTGLPLQRKKTEGAYAEREPVKGVNWKTTKEAKPRYTPTAEVAEETTPKAQRVGASKNLKEYGEVAGTLARQATVTDVSPRPKKTKELRTASPEGKEAKIKRAYTAAEKRKLARDVAEGEVPDFDPDGLAFRTAKTGEAVVDPTEAKGRIVEIKSRLPKGVNLVYEPTLEGMKPETLAMLKAEGYKEGTKFKGVVLPDGTIVVVGDAHTDMTDLEETLFHEMVGHYGIDTVIGLNRLKEFAQATNLEKLAKKLGGDALWRDAVDAMTFAVEQKGDPDLAALREIIAYTAQQRITESFKEKAGRWLQQLVGMVRAGLRAMGFKNFSEMSTSDVFYAIKRADKAFNDRTIGPYRAADGKMSFRTKKEQTPFGKSFVATEPSIKDKLLGNLMGLSGRVQFVDQYAALDAAMKKGLSQGVISDLEAEQAAYYLRFGQQANQFATQALTNGPLTLTSETTARGKEFIYKAKPGANMVEVAKALEKSGIKNSTQLEAMFTAYMAGKRAKQVGWNKLNIANPALAEQEYNDIMAELRGNDKARTAFEEAAKIYKEYNNGLIDFLVQTGYMSKQKAAELKAIDYVPYYRVQGGELQLLVDKERPIRIANIKDEPMLHELVGDNQQILPIFTSSAQNAFILTRMGLRNQMMKDNAMLLARMGIASRIGKGSGPQGSNTVRYKVNGEDNFAVIDTDMYGVPAELIVKGMEGIKTTLPLAIKMMGLPANVLRQFVTRNPAYAIRQVIRDPLTAWFTTGTDGVPVLNSFKELATMVAGRSEAERKLMEAGAISSNVMTGGQEDVAKAMRDMSMGRSGWTKLMAKADALAMQGDAATRAVVYKDSIGKGMSEMQALMRTLESMNFSRRGLSPTIQMLSTVIPFFNAQIQGLDVLYRAFTGKMPYSEQLKIRQKLYTRGLLLAAGTLAYAAAMEDDEAYKRAKPEERLGNWFVYTPFSDEPVRVPIPFELGYLFKALPEAVFNMGAEDERASDVTKGMGKLVALSNPFSLPQAIKPLTEVVLGKSFFGGDIESMREKTQMLPTERLREGTTEVAKMLGSITGDAGLTPIKIDYLIRGYTGGLGIAIASLANPLLNTEAQAVDKPTMKTSKLPFIGGLFQPVEGRGTLDAAYERMLEIQQAQGTFKSLAESGKQEEAKAFLEQYRNKVAAASLSGTVQQQLGELAKAKRQVIASPRSTAEKDELLAKLDKAQYELAKRFLAVTGETRPQ